MTGVHTASAWSPFRPIRTSAFFFGAAKWLVAASLWAGGPLLALWVGSQTQTSGTPSMTSVVLVVVVLATVSYAQIALLRVVDRLQNRVDGSAVADGTRVPWLHGPRARSQPKAESSRADAVATALPKRSTREPLVLIDGSAGTSRPWEAVIPHLEFGFEVLAGVLPRNGSIDGTKRAMDRGGWQTAHVVARPRDALAAVELARQGRARSLLILDDDDATEDCVAVATEIAEFAACRSPR